MRTLERLAGALGCQPADLLQSDRLEPALQEEELRLLAGWRQLPRRKREAILSLLH